MTQARDSMLAAPRRSGDPAAPCGKFEARAPAAFVPAEVRRSIVRDRHSTRPNARGNAA